LNESIQTETYQDVNGERIEETYYEYDYNEFSDNIENLDLETIESNPGKYLDYIKAEETELQKTLQKLEELKASIERGLNR